jgi:hypothetical protein
VGTLALLFIRAPEAISLVARTLVSNYVFVTTISFASALADEPSRRWTRPTVRPGTPLRDSSIRERGNRNPPRIPRQGEQEVTR